MNTPLQERQLRVLHIDDKPTIIGMVEALLKDEMQVKGVPSLCDAHEELQHSAACYDLLLVDLNLHDSEGAATVGALVRYGLPIVVLSGLNDPKVLTKAVEFGADDFLAKPGITRVKLVNRLRFAHARHLKKVAYEEQQLKERAAKRRQMFGGSTVLESLKPFISCSNVATPSRPPFAAA